MGASSNTDNMLLPLFGDNDKPTWRGDVNAAMHIIDDYVTEHLALKLDRESYALFSPMDYGAVGDGVTNDTAAIRAAAAAAEAVGGGTVSINKLFAFKGVLIVPNNVVFEGYATRAEPGRLDDVPPVSGLIALDGTAQLQVGIIGSGALNHASGVSNLYVDGKNVSSTATTYPGLVRIYGVNIYINNLFCYRSGGDGVVFAGTQNSTVVGGQSTMHAGCALVMDHGAGGVSFHGGYYGTSGGGALLSRLSVETDMVNAYPFGTTNCNWFGTVFESYDATSYGLPTIQARHIEWRAGGPCGFYGCNFTSGAKNTLNAAFYLSSADGGIPSSISISSATCWNSNNVNQHMFTVVGNQLLAVEGVNTLADDGTHHSLDVFHLEGAGSEARIMQTGYWIKNASTVYVSTSGGAFTGNLRSETPAGMQYIFRDPASPDQFQVVSFKEETDDYYRGFINGHFELAWFDGESNVATAVLQRRPTANGLEHVIGQFEMVQGYKLGPQAPRIEDFPGVGFVGAGTTTELDVAVASRYYIASAAPNFTLDLKNGVQGSRATVIVQFTAGVVTPAVHWTATKPNNTADAIAWLGAFGASEPVLANGINCLEFWHNGVAWVQVK